MAEDRKSTEKEFHGCCEGMPIADMMRKMMEAKKSGAPSHCAEMMSRMMEMFCAGKKKEESAQNGEENSVSDVNRA